MINNLLMPESEISLWIMLTLGFVSSFVGGMLGIGGGVFIVPALVIFLHLPAQVGIGSSLISIVATASTASISYIKNNLTDIRLCLLLIVFTVPGAILGSFIATFISSAVLILIFSIILIGVAISMLFRPRWTEETLQQSMQSDLDVRIKRPYWWSYYDMYLKKEVFYSIRNIPLGMALSFLGGIISSLFGIGGGVIYVPVLSLLLGVPIKIAIACSSFLIAITAASGSFVNYFNGFVHPFLIAPLVLGSFVGASLGSRISQKSNPGVLRMLFFVILILIAITIVLRYMNIVRV
jgi:uncharacterized membrane protein YfcA